MLAMLSSKLNPFDRDIVTAIGILLILIGATIWRGDHTAARESADETALVAAVEPSATAPESHLIYLAVDARGTNQIFGVEVNAANQPPNPPIALTNAAEGVWDFTSDPARSFVVFSALRRDGGADLWRAEPGDEASLLLACAEAACSTPAFSRDGTLLAYSQRAVTGQTVAMINPPRLWLLDVATGESAALFADGQRLGFDPVFSSDGSWLSYVAPVEQGIGLVNLQDGKEILLSSGTGENGAWHPNHPEIVTSHVMTASAMYYTHLIATNVESGTRNDLSGADAAVFDDSPAFSPDGDWIAFRRKIAEGEGATPGKQIWIMRTDGSEARALTASAEHDHAPPQWSSEGTRLTFHRYNLRNAPIILAVMVYDIESNLYWEAVTPGQEPQWIR